MNALLREPLTLTYYHELSIAETSFKLGGTVKTFKARLFRGRRLLQKRTKKLLPILPHATQSSKC
jgi:DNA-directed RNA polymerase specialized sigma24 family protein